VLHSAQYLTGTTPKQRVRLPANVLAEESCTINAWMRPKVTECGQPPEWPGVKQCLTVTALLNGPSRIPYHKTTQQRQHNGGRRKNLVWNVTPPAQCSKSDTGHQDISLRAESA